MGQIEGKVVEGVVYIRYRITLGKQNHRYSEWAAVDGLVPASLITELREEAAQKTFLREGDKKS